MEMIQISKQEYEQLKEENRILKEVVASLTKEIVELKAKLNKDSTNSNKPPSSDGPKKRAIKNSRERSGKSSGGQPGHEGTTKNLDPNPDTIVVLKPIKECDECGGEVTLLIENYTVRQVRDIQPIKAITVEYRATDGVCVRCGKIHKASFPEDVNGIVSYGNNLKAIVTYLTTYQLLPLKRTTELVEDLLGVKISQGTIVSSGQEAYEKLEGTEGLTKDELVNSEVVNFDETSTRVNGKTHWLHSAGTETATVYLIHPKRGIAAMDEMGILPLFIGTAIHDHWKSYYHYIQCAHGECNEHHLRSLQYLYEELGESWAFEMACLLLRIKAHVDLSKLFGTDHLEQENIDIYVNLYREILTNAATQDDAPKESQRMAKRLREYEDETLLFMIDFNVPFTNNLAERDVRMPKAKQKISGGFRSDDGAKAFARIRGFVSTVKKKGKNVLDGLVSVFNGDSSEFLYPSSH